MAATSSNNNIDCDKGTFLSAKEVWTMINEENNRELDIIDFDDISLNIQSNDTIINSGKSPLLKNKTKKCIYWYYYIIVYICLTLIVTLLIVFR